MADMTAADRLARALGLHDVHASPVEVEAALRDAGLIAVPAQLDDDTIGSCSRWGGCCAHDHAS